MNDSSNVNSVFLLGWEVKLIGDQQCADFIAIQRSTEMNAWTVSIGMELVFENNRLIEAYNIRQGHKSPRALSEEELGLAYVDGPVHPILIMSDHPEGKHQLGGALPEGISFPENDCKVPFQYLGCFSNGDEHLNWLSFPLHLMCPIFLDFDKVYLDYTDPHYPVLINRLALEQVDTSYTNLNKESEIVYTSRRFNFFPFDDFEDPLHAGLPNWIQYPTFPHCPKTGKRMRFLCQINGGVLTQSSNVVIENSHDQRSFDKLNFWGDGDLYIFVEPDERTVCYFIQNT